MSLGLPSRTYFPGELIHKEVPFVQILPRVVKDEFCETCHRRFSNLRFCKQCRAVKYCGKVCQRKDWSDHRLECKNMENVSEEKGFDLVRLLGRVIHKIKGKEWKTIKTTVLGAEVNFDDIDPHYKEMTENPMLNLLYKELKERTKKFIGVSNMPSDIDMLKIIGKVLYNSFSSNSSPGVCFFLGMFVFEKQCIPNSSFVVHENSLKVWTNKKIVKSSEKISVSFRSLFESSKHYFAAIDDLPCKCSDCSLPYGESVLSRILDDKKAFSVISATESFIKASRTVFAFKMGDIMKDTVDSILEMHSGVLGRTNLLHLTMLVLRCFYIGGRPIDIAGELKKLENIMSYIFGEFSKEMLQIYVHLAVIYEDLGLIVLELLYKKKKCIIVRPKIVKKEWTYFPTFYSSRGRGISRKFPENTYQPRCFHKVEVCWYYNDAEHVLMILQIENLISK